MGRAVCGVDLIERFGDDRDDAALTQMSSDRAGGVGLVSAQPVRAGPRSTNRTGYSQLAQQGQQGGRVGGLARSDGDDQRQTVTVNVCELVSRRHDRPGWGATPAPSAPVTPDWEFRSMADFAVAAAC